MKSFSKKISIRLKSRRRRRSRHKRLLKKNSNHSRNRLNEKQVNENWDENRYVSCVILSWNWKQNNNIWYMKINTLTYRLKHEKLLRSFCSWQQILIFSNLISKNHALLNLLFSSIFRWRLTLTCCSNHLMWFLYFFDFRRRAC